MDSAGRNRAARIAIVRSKKGAELAEPLSEYKDCPVRFALEVLGVRLWSKQREIAHSVRDNRRTSVAACYGSGKTFTAAVITLWWLMTRRPAMVVTTAPTGRQVKELLWREVNKLFQAAKRRLPGRCLEAALKIDHNWRAYGFSSDKPNSVAGIHEANVLFIEDEAAGMDPEVVEGFSGITIKSDARHLKIGNPICTAGPFWDSHMHPVESKRWNKISINALQTPNVRSGKPLVPGLVEREFVEDARRKWLARGLLHLWEQRVLGRFVEMSTDQLVSATWARLAAERWESADTMGVRSLAVDVAGGGQDETVVSLREGQRIRILTSWHSDDLVEQSEWVTDLANEHQVERIFVDATAIGLGLYNNLARARRNGDLPQGCQVHGIKLQEGPLEPEIFADRNAEIQWAMRCALNPNDAGAIALCPDDGQVLDELTWRSWYKDERRGLVCVEGKKAMKKRTGNRKSPDYADSVALHFAPVVEVFVR